MGGAGSQEGEELPGWGGNSLQAQQLWDRMARRLGKAAGGHLDPNSGSFGLTSLE